MGVNQSTCNEGDGGDSSSEMKATTAEMEIEGTATTEEKKSQNFMEEAPSKNIKESTVGDDGPTRSTNSPGKQIIEMELQPNYKRAGSIIPSSARKAEIIAANPEKTKTKLDEKTLKIMRDYLVSLKFEKEPLEEEEVVELSLRTCQYANDRIKFRQNLLQDASDLASNETYYDRVYRKEEYYALAHEFFNLISYEVNALSEETEPKTRINSNTVRWVRKAAGLNRPRDDRNDHRHAHHHGDSDAVDSDASVSGRGAAAPRRLTRGMARNTRVKIREKKRKAEQAGLDALRQAVEDLERERGEPFPEITMPDNDTDNDSNNFYKGKRSSKKKKHALTARIRGAWNNPLLSTQVRLTRILVRGKHVKKPTSDEELIDWRLGHMREQNRQHELEQNAANLVSEDGYSSTGEESSIEGRKDTYDVPPVPNQKDPLDLAFSEWMYRRDLGHQNIHDSDDDDDDMVPKDLDSITIPEALLNEDIEFLPLQQEEECASASAKPSSAVRDVRGQTKCRSDDFYSESSQKVRNFLRGPGRIWTRCEFFYSDIDKPWYDFNDFASDVAKLGIRPNASLTRREWSAVRRRIKRRPRLFSRNFIVSEIKRRNQFRKAVRKLIQHQPRHFNRTGLDIPAPIEPGTRVTAYSKKFHVLHRGVVMSHDQGKHGYIVNFEQEDLGTEFCPDTEVASYYGQRPVLLHASTSSYPVVTSTIQAGEEGMEMDSRAGEDVDGEEDYGKRLGAGKESCEVDANIAVSVLRSYDELSARSRSDMDGTEPEAETEKKVATVANHHEIPDTAPGRYDDPDFERKDLVTLLSIVDACVRRKRLLLDGIDKLRILEEKRNTTNFGAASPPAQGSEAIQSDIHAWLLSNLVSTNEALESAQLNLEAMYGDIYNKKNEKSEHLSHGVAT